MVKMYSLSLTLCRCVATLRDAFFGVFLCGAHFFILGELSMKDLHSLYTNIGMKIKELATWIFVFEALLCTIAGILVIAMSYGAIIVIACGLGILIFGPLLCWMSTWLLYGIGVLIEKLCLIERNTRGLLKNSQAQRTEVINKP